MNLGIGLVVISILCLVAALGFGAPLWVNILGFVSGIVGLVLLSRAKKSGGGT